MPHKDVKPPASPGERPEPLPPGSYYHSQIIGLRVETTRGEALGSITEIISSPNTEVNDVYVAKGVKGEVLIPAIADVVKRIDTKNGVMVIEPLKGML